MGWNIVVENHQCVYRQRAHPHSGVVCYNDKNECRGSCAEDVCPIQIKHECTCPDNKVRS